MKCPYCDAPMGWLDHGVCPDCEQYCGCSYNPTSDSDYCSTHRPRRVAAKAAIESANP